MPDRGPIRAPVTVPVAVLLVAVLAAAGVLLWSRVEYKQWPWSAYPDTLHFCARDYAPVGVQTRQQVADSGFRYAGDLPGFLNSGQIWTTEKANSTGAGCGGAVWVRLSDGRFEQMALEGGP